MDINISSLDDNNFNGTALTRINFNGVKIWGRAYKFTLNMTMSYDNWYDQAYQGCLVAYTDYYWGWSVGSIRADGNSTSFKSIKVTRVKVNGVCDNWGGSWHNYIDINARYQEILNTTRNDLNYVRDTPVFDLRDEDPTPVGVYIKITVSLSVTLLDNTTKEITVTLYHIQDIGLSNKTFTQEVRVEV